MTRRTRRGLTGIVVLLAAFGPVAMLTSPASAFPAGDPIFQFKYNIVATTHIKRANLTLTTSPGVFKGGIDLANGQLKGSISLPDVTFTQTIAGPVGLTATSSIVSSKPVTGHVNIGTLKVKATSTFNIHLKSMYLAQPQLPVALPIPLPIPPLPQVNLVGDGCTTATPITVTMSGKASFDKPSTFTGTFTIPDFTNCQAMTTVINQQIPGPGNTFSATASPSS